MEKNNSCTSHSPLPVLSSLQAILFSLVEILGDVKAVCSSGHMAVWMQSLWLHTLPCDIFSLGLRQFSLAHEVGAFDFLPHV